MKRPNIVFFFTDDQRYDTIGLLNGHKISTPNMDELVRTGTTFTQAHITGGTHGAVCMPSRAMLHTGRDVFSIKDAGETISDRHEMLGETLQKHGYNSMGIGKWHNGKASFNRNHNMGSHIFFGGMADHWNVPMYDYDPTGQYKGSGAYIKNPFKTNETQNYKFDYCYQGKHSTEVIAQGGIDFIDQYDEDNPFYLYMSFLAPHDPRTMPDEYKKMYSPEDIELPVNYQDRYPFNNGGLGNRDEKLASFPRKPDEIKRHIAEYYGMITHLDHELGRVIESLKRKGIYENTLIILAGDNGLAVGQHGLMGKQSVHEHSVRVPLIFSGPGVSSGHRTSAFAYLFDIYPTLCAYLGMDIPETVKGISHLDVLEGAEASERKELYLIYSRFQRAIKTDRYKLIDYVKGGKHIESQLFDLESDPYETKNLVSEETRSIIDDLRSRMPFHRDQWQETKTYWGKFFWEGMSKSHSDLAPADVKSYRFSKYREMLGYQKMVLLK